MAQTNEEGGNQVTISTTGIFFTSTFGAGAVLCPIDTFAIAPVLSLQRRLFVNIDGFAYLAFIQNERTLTSGSCQHGSATQPRDLTSVLETRMVLWQIHPDGSYRSTVVEESKSSGQLSNSTPLGSSTGAIIPDGLGGVLLSVRQSRNVEEGNVSAGRDESFRSRTQVRTPGVRIFDITGCSEPLRAPNNPATPAPTGTGAGHSTVTPRKRCGMSGSCVAVLEP